MATKRRSQRGYIVIDADRCKGCSFCITVCPKEMIGMASHINRMGYTPVAVIEELAATCTGCRVCAIMCPDVAISVYRPVGVPKAAD